MALPSLAGAEWLRAPAVAGVFSLLDRDGEEARIAGGAVRNALMGLPITDIDFATTATPDAVEQRAAKSGVKSVPTGREHGTITLICHGRPFEVTTLREDIETDGRRAVVRFGRDWAQDARRRDFTINALFLSADGTVHDPIGGYPDILARRVRFIGNGDQRILEDRLRILRFFRFHAQIESGALDPAGLAACIRARDGLRDLSAERIGQEMRKLVVAPVAPATVEIMQDAGILPVVLGGVGYLARFRKLADAETAVGVEPVFARRLAALGCRIEEDVARLAHRMRLSNHERGRMGTALLAAKTVRPDFDERDARAALHRLGADAFRDGLLLAAAEQGAPDSRIQRLHELPDRWSAPAFPVDGGDVMAAGVPAGPAVGEYLRRLENWWIAQDFQPDLEALKRELRRIAATAHSR
jgi:tRNA nucleotidyltransferase/poly(A) polymerase